MIRFDNVTAAYGGEPALVDITLSIPTGTTAALMGPSGCGKSTLLQLAAGLLTPAAGTVTAEGRLAYAFQDPRLLPWFTAARNVNAVLSDRAATMPEALKWLEAVGLADAADKYPRELSGGMRQRVGLARALAYGADILLLDEPTKGLDAGLREDIWALLRDYARGRTVLLATHDPAEAAALADRVYTYKDKRFVLK